MKAEIIVTEEEIGIAERGLNTRCAIAAAIMNQIPSAQHVKVNKDTIAYLDRQRGLRYTFETPAVAASFIQRWDRGDAVGPIGFWLTEQTMISCRPPRRVSTRERVKRATQAPIIKDPGSRMKRHPDDDCSTD